MQQLEHASILLWKNEKMEKWENGKKMEGNQYKSFLHSLGKLGQCAWTWQAKNPYKSIKPNKKQEGKFASRTSRLGKGKFLTSQH